MAVSLLNITMPVLQLGQFIFVAALVSFPYVASSASVADRIEQIIILKVYSSGPTFEDYIFHRNGALLCRDTNKSPWTRSVTHDNGKDVFLKAAEIFGSGEEQYNNSVNRHVTHAATIEIVCFDSNGNALFKGKILAPSLIDDADKQGQALFSAVKSIQNFSFQDAEPKQ